jgi:DNA-binding transcriptional ArsR family regulator
MMRNMPGLARSASLGPIFGALANEQRRAILARLAQGPASTPDIALQFDLTKQALNRHLVVLEDAGLLERTMHGRTYDLALVPASLDRISRWLGEIRRGWHASLDRLDDILRSSNRD